MTLKDWIVRSGMSQAEFARRMDVTPMMVSDVVNGKRRFSPENARKVVEITAGDVTLEEVLFPGSFSAAACE